MQMSQLSRLIPIANDVRRYGIALIVATHPEHELASPVAKKYVRFGSSPRGLQALILARRFGQFWTIAITLLEKISRPWRCLSCDTG